MRIPQTEFVYRLAEQNGYDKATATRAVHGFRYAVDNGLSLTEVADRGAPNIGPKARQLLHVIRMLGQEEDIDRLLAYAKERYI